MTFHQLRQALHTELDLWRTKRKSETVKQNSIYVILAISATPPVTSCECEKSVSVLTFTAKKGCKSYFDCTSDHICIKTVIILVQV